MMGWPRNGPEGEGAMQFFALDFPVSLSLGSLAAGMVIALLLVAGGLTLGARADRRRLLAQRPEPSRKAA
jgi:hypothetical protein